MSDIMSVALTGQVGNCVLLQPPGKNRITIFGDRDILCATLKIILGSNAREKLQ